jgi:2-octaprenyl-6-methoxyphenol hydroxylase
MTEHHALDADVIIVGGGLNGPALSLALAQAGLRSIVLDALPLETRADPEFNGRAYAQALASRRFWQAVGVWPLVTQHVQEIRDILVTDGKIGEGAAPLFLHFDHRELDEGVFGYMIEDRWLRAALHQRLEEEALVAHRAPAKVVGVDAGA